MQEMRASESRNKCGEPNEMAIAKYSKGLFSVRYSPCKQCIETAYKPYLKIQAS